LVSADSSGKVCYFSAIKKRFIRDFSVKNPVKKIDISILGLVLIAYQKQDLSSSKTIIEARDLSGKKLKSLGVVGKCTAFKIIQLPGELDCLVIALENQIMILRCYDLEMMAKAKIEKIVYGIAYSKESRTLCVICENGIYYRELKLNSLA